MKTIVLAGGSADRGETVYTRAAFDFGRRVAREGWTLRTGGGSGRSIMGAGGRVEGVILRKFWPVRHRGLHSLRSMSTFALRKAGLFRGADASVFFPGGYGTLDELGDVLALRQTGFTRMAILIVNVSGYFDAFLAWERHAGREGFLYGPRFFDVVSTPAAAVRRLRGLV